MKVLVASMLCLLLTAACNRNIYVGHDEAFELAGAPALVTPELDHADQMVDAGPADAGAPKAGTLDAAASMSMTVLPPVTFTPLAPQCLGGQADCDGSPDNGCETDLSNDPKHCGSCSTGCTTSDCVCENGKLTLHCASGRADCDADSSNGCETDLQTSTEHCGACNHVCHTNGHDVVTATCVAGQCEMTCEPRVSPETDCDHNPDNGCETYLWFDANNCGKCGNRCATACEAGTCML